MVVVSVGSLRVLCLDTESGCQIIMFHLLQSFSVFLYQLLLLFLQNLEGLLEFKVQRRVLRDQTCFCLPHVFGEHGGLLLVDDLKGIYSLLLLEVGQQKLGVFALFQAEFGMQEVYLVLHLDHLPLKLVLEMSDHFICFSLNAAFNLLNSFEILEGLVSLILPKCVITQSVLHRRRGWFLFG